MAKKAQVDSPVDPAEAEESHSRMTFGEHLDELRKSIMRAGMGALVGVGICVFFMYDIFNLVARPYRLAAQAHNVPDVFNTFKPQEAFFTILTLAFQTGLVLSSPWIIYQAWKFIGAGLYQKERKIVYRYVGPSALLFLMGVAFFYFIVLPMALNFFMSFTSHSAGPPPVPNWLDKMLGLGPHEAAKPKKGPESAPAIVPGTGPNPATALATGASPATVPATMPLQIPVLAHDPGPPADGQAYLFFNENDSRIKLMVGDEKYTLLVVQQGTLFNNNWRADDYLGFVMFTALVFGLAFEMPMVILVLALVGIVQTQTFRNIRKYAYFGILIGAVIAAPSGDPLMLAFLFVPLVGLYEAGIIAAAIATRNRVQPAD